MPDAQWGFPRLSDCRHERTAIRWRIRGSMIGRQCLDCGRNPKGGSWMRLADAEAEVGDLNSVPDWQDQPEPEKPQQRLLLTGLLNTERTERTFDRAVYDAHLRSQRWRELRALIRRRCENLCEGCLVAPVDDVHHLTYKHLGDELAYELIGLCRTCHERAHNRSA